MTRQSMADDDNGGGAQTTYDDVVTDVCHTISATAHSIKTVPVPLAAAFYRSADCIHVEGDLEGFNNIPYNVATNTKTDAHSVIFGISPPDSNGDDGDSVEGTSSWLSRDGSVQSYEFSAKFSSRLQGLQTMEVNFNRMEGRDSRTRYYSVAQFH
ncbi:hypothetical protein FB451DRAFT_1167933 [Mycena latifolia]|nr:hypothetical protein FB451DRAFT_1167933 [Mycena latifolia]